MRHRSRPTTARHAEDISGPDEEKKVRAPATINKAVASLASLLRYARRLGLIAWSLEGLAVKPEPRENREGPTRQQVLELVEHLEQQTDAKAVRDLAILRLLHDVGLRRSEVTGLDLVDVDLERSAVWPRRKRNKERSRLALPSRTAQALRQWIQIRGAQEGALFVRLDRARSSSLEPLGGEGVRRMLRRRAKAAGIDATVQAKWLGRGFSMR